MDNFSLADIAAVTRDNTGRDGFLGGNGIIILILFLLFFVFNGNVFGGRGAADTNAATKSDVTSGFNFSQLDNGIRGLERGLCDLGYTTNTNMMQGFHGVDNALCAGFNSVNQNISNLSNQMQQCCCDLKTTMLQDKYEQMQRELSQAQGIIANSAQSQYILGQLGRYYTFPAVNPNTCYGNCGCG